MSRSTSPTPSVASLPEDVLLISSTSAVNSPRASESLHRQRQGDALALASSRCKTGVRANVRTFLSFLGPGFMVAVGYMDPGNWATDLAAGSRFQYDLLFVILLSNFCAIFLQTLAAKLGVVTGMDLAQACRKYVPMWLNWILYILCEIAIIACDLAEVIGSAVALNLLFNLPLWIGCLVTSLDVVLILLAYRSSDAIESPKDGAAKSPSTMLKGARIFEAGVAILVLAVGLCFALELAMIPRIPVVPILRGFLPSATAFTNREALYLAMGIVGATVMPHNLYLHSHVVQARAFMLVDASSSEDEEAMELVDSSGGSLQRSPVLGSEQVLSLAKQAPVKRLRRHLRGTDITRTIRHTVADLCLALTFAVFVNCAILIVSAAVYSSVEHPDGPEREGVADLFSGHQLLTTYLSPAAGTVYAVALLLAGQSSTITATLAGQIVMEGFVHWGNRIRPWQRRLATRLVAIVPAVIVAVVLGRPGLQQALVASQVVLSIQLPFAVIPLVWLTSRADVMRDSVASARTDEGEGEKAASFANGRVARGAGWAVSAILVGLNVFLLIQTARGEA